MFNNVQASQTVKTVALVYQDQLLIHWLHASARKATKAIIARSRHVMADTFIARMVALVTMATNTITRSHANVKMASRDQHARTRMSNNVQEKQTVVTMANVIQEQKNTQVLIVSAILATQVTIARQNCADHITSVSMEAHVYLAHQKLTASAVTDLQAKSVKSNYASLVCAKMKENVLMEHICSIRLAANADMALEDPFVSTKTVQYKTIRASMVATVNRVTRRILTCPAYA